MLEALKAKVKQGSVKAFEVYRVNPKDSGRQSECEDDGVINAIKRSEKDVWK